MERSVGLLLVEDEAMIQEMLESELTDAGFEVVSASSGTQALAELDGDVVRFRALICDIRLGEGPDGWKVARRARELAPDMVVIYISGDSSAEWSAKGVPNSMMIAKPFVIAQIITAVSTMLNEAEPP
jgi:DNA-binding response OmpR family regulator